MRQQHPVKALLLSPRPKSPPSFITFFTFFVISLLSKTTTSQGVGNGNSNINTNTNSPGVFALPEIHIKLRNRTTLQVEPNTPVELSPKLGFIEFSCTADYPVKWEYLVNNKTIPVLDVVYRRLIRNISDFSNPKRNRFMALITLHGLLESQTGKYLCRHYNEKLGNNNYAISSYFDVFVPGNKTFNAISSISFVNKTASFVSIHCPVTNPKLHVRLFKLNEKHFNKTEQIVWKPIYANYEPTDGFRLFAGLGRELQGTYNCTAENGASLISVIADPTEKELYHSSSPSISVNSSCWENFKFMQYIRSKRLECFCRDSYGLFVNDNYEFENRQASCSPPFLMRELGKCADWRIEEFFGNEEKSGDVCFHDQTQVQLDGSGSRPSLQVKGETFPNGDNDQRNFSFTKLSVTYNGFIDWAGDFMLAVCRSDFCLLSDNHNDRLDGNDGADSRNNTTNKTGDTNQHSLEYVETGPSLRHHFPLAYYQAVWNDLIVNGTDIKLVYVFQAHSLSYAWFPYATGEIQWGNKGMDVNGTLFSSSTGGQRYPDSASPPGSGSGSDSSSESVQSPPVSGAPSFLTFMNGTSLNYSVLSIFLSILSLMKL